MMPELIHSVAQGCKGSVLGAGALAEQYKNPCPSRASAPLALHIWKLVIHLIAPAPCIIVEIPLKPKLEFEHG